MDPINKIEAGAEQIYDDVSHSLTKRYYDILDSMSGYLKKKLITLVLYLTALALLLIGITGTGIYAVHVIAKESTFTLSEAWGIVGGAFILISALVACNGYLRSKTTIDESEEDNSGLTATTNAQRTSNNRLAQARSSSESHATNGIKELKDGVSELISPAYYVNKHPLVSLLAASLVGTYLGKISKDNKTHLMQSTTSTDKESKQSRASQKSADTNSSAMSFSQSAYALIAPLVVNAVRKKVASSVTEYLSKLTSDQSNSNREQTFRTRGTSRHHESDTSELYETEETYSDHELH